MSPSIAASNDVDESKTKEGTTENMIKNLSTLTMESVAVACYDLGEFMRFYPAGKRILDRIRGKNIDPCVNGP